MHLSLYKEYPYVTREYSGGGVGQQTKAPTREYLQEMSNKGLCTYTDQRTGALAKSHPCSLPEASQQLIPSTGNSCPISTERSSGAENKTRPSPPQRPRPRCLLLVISNNFIKSFSVSCPHTHYRGLTTHRPAFYASCPWYQLHSASRNRCAGLRPRYTGKIVTYYRRFTQTKKPQI